MQHFNNTCFGIVLNHSPVHRSSDTSPTPHEVKLSKGERYEFDDLRSLVEIKDMN